MKICLAHPANEGGNRTKTIGLSENTATLSYTQLHSATLKSVYHHVPIISRSCRVNPLGPNLILCDLWHPRPKKSPRDLRAREKIGKLLVPLCGFQGVPGRIHVETRTPSPCICIALFLHHFASTSNSLGFGVWQVAHYEVRSKSLETKKWARMLMRVILASEDATVQRVKPSIMPWIAMDCHGLP